ncbi:MAG: hypothetical protein ACM3SR_06260 [Ignavibacteriales bacterium]
MQSSKQNEPNPRHEFYRRAITILNQSRISFLVGGAFALKRYTGIARQWTKDFDIFIYPEDCEHVLEVFSASDYKTELTFPHWLGKAFCGEDLIDIIFSSGNGICKVDDAWFEHAIEGEILNMPVRLIPLEEMIWSKAFIMERERYDGADIAHILRACSKGLDWSRLLGRFGSYWRVLFSHLILFGFIYPDEQLQIPSWVMDELLSCLQNEINNPLSINRICQGTLLSVVQYRIDIECWEYRDARLIPRGNMTSEEIAHWTRAFEEDK